MWYKDEPVLRIIRIYFLIDKFTARFINISCSQELSDMVFGNHSMISS